MSVAVEPRLTPPQESPTPARASLGARALRRMLTDRVTLLVALLVVFLLVYTVLDYFALLNAPFDIGYLSSSLISLVPSALLAVAEMFVILSGRSGIDLSVAGMLCLVGMFFGWLVGPLGWPVAVAVVAALLAGALLGALNGYLVGYLGFPPLIATLASGFAFASLAMLSNNGGPFAGPAIAATNTLTKPIGFGPVQIPAHVFTVLVPCLVLAWFALARTRWGRQMFAVGTNDTAAAYAAQPVRRTRASAYLVSGVLCAVAAIVNVAQFASARPDAGTAGTGVALPAITIAVLGGVAISGGVARVGGTALAALFVTWLNAAILITFPGSMGPRMQLLALGAVLICSVLLNSFATRRYGLQE